MPVITRSRSQIISDSTRTVVDGLNETVRADIVKTGKQLDALKMQHCTPNSEIVKEFFTKNPMVTFAEYINTLNDSFPEIYLSKNTSSDNYHDSNLIALNYRCFEFMEVHVSGMLRPRAFAYMVSQFGPAFWKAQRHTGRNLSYLNMVYDKIMDLDVNFRVQFPEFRQFNSDYNRNIEKVCTVTRQWRKN